MLMMALPIEATLTAVELLDAGWSRLTRGTTSKEDKEMQAKLEDRALLLEGELAKAKVEARKLRFAIEEYKQLLLNVNREHGVGVGKEASTGENAITAAGTEELIKEVEQRINSPAFLDRLLAPPGSGNYMENVDTRGDLGPTGNSSISPPSSSTGVSEISEEVETSVSASSASTSSERGSTSSPASSPVVKNSAGFMEVCVDAEDDSQCWQWVTAREMHGGIQDTTEPCAGLDGEEDYEIVQGDDVVDGIAQVLARFIATHPDYKGRSVEELQQAIVVGFKASKGKGLMRSLWEWSKFAYKTSRWAATGYNVYRHPLMVRAVVLTLLSSTRLILGFAAA